MNQPGGEGLSSQRNRGTVSGFCMKAKSILSYPTLSSLMQLRNGGPVPCDGLPLPWVESQASVLLLTMVQRCPSQYDLHRLLQLLAEVDKLLKSNGEVGETHDGRSDL